MFFPLESQKRRAERVAEAYGSVRMLPGLGSRKAPQPLVQRLPGGEKCAEAGSEAWGPAPSTRSLARLQVSVGEPMILWEVLRLVTLFSSFPCG